MRDHYCTLRGFIRTMSRQLRNRSTTRTRRRAKRRTNTVTNIITRNMRLPQYPGRGFLINGRSKRTRTISVSTLKNNTTTHTKSDFNFLRRQNIGELINLHRRLNNLRNNTTKNVNLLIIIRLSSFSIVRVLNHLLNHLLRRRRTGEGIKGGWATGTNLINGLYRIASLHNARTHNTRRQARPVNSHNPRQLVGQVKINGIRRRHRTLTLNHRRNYLRIIRRQRLRQFMTGSFTGILPCRF